jgi:TolB-like protein
MTDTPSEREGDSAWARLRRRKVVQWGLAYAAGSWALLQGVGFVADAFGWPAVTKQLATIALLVGLPVAVVLAWYHGDKGQQRVTRPELLVLAFLLLGGGALLWHFEKASRTATAPTPAVTPRTNTVVPANDPSIAVLPFVDMSAAKDQEYFADGMSEEVLNLLTQLPQLRVIARTSSFSFKGKEVDIATIAHTLNVAHVLEGSVRKSGDTLRITAQLIRTSDSSHLWSQTYDRKLTDVFQVQDEIAGAVVAALKVKLLPEQQVTNKFRTANIEAYNQYLLGNSVAGTPEGLRQGVAALRQAVRLDPGFAAAYASLAIAEYWASEYAETAAEIESGKQRALAAAERAVALAPDLADGYSARGWIRMAWTWDWAGAQSDLEKALALDPGNADVRGKFGDLMASLGRVSDAIEADTKAVELNPLDPWVWSALGLYRMAGSQWAQARNALNRSLAIEPGFMLANYHLGTLELLLDRPQEALTAFRRSDAFFRFAGIAMAELALGNARESKVALDQLIAAAAHSAAYQIAEVHSWRGETDMAFEWLDRAYAQRDGGLALIKIDPLLASLRKDPRYAALLTKLGLPP